MSFDFFDSYSKQEIVTTFMALLELMKTRFMLNKKIIIVKFCYLIQETQQEDTTEVEEHSDIS